MQGPGPTIRSRLVLLVLAATLPMLLFSAILLERSYRVSIGLTEQNALGTARRVADAVQAKLGRAEAIGVALSQLPSRDVADLATLENAATRALETAGLDAMLDVIDADGNIVAHTGQINGGRLGREPDQDVVRRVFATGQSVISGVSVGVLTHHPQVAVHVPLVRDGRVRYDVAVQLRAESISVAAVPGYLARRWFVIISDSAGRIICDSDQSGGRPGAVIPPGLAALYAGRKEGFAHTIYPGHENILLGFVHTERADWAIGVGIPAWVVYGPLLRSIGALAGGGAAVLLTSLALAWLIGRNIIRPLGALAQEAVALASGRAPDLRAVGNLAEAAAAGQALAAASVELRARAAEREAALRRAETSEARLLLAQEIGKIGTWDIDLVSGERSWSQQLFELYGRDPALGPPQGEFGLDLLHPHDRAKFAATQAQARRQPMSYQQVFRVLQPDGGVRWLRSSARSEFENGHPVRLIGTTMDVTDRLEAERLLRESATRLEAEVAARTQELAQSEERFRTYFEHSSDALVVVRVEDHGRFVYEIINRSGERLFGLRRRDIVGRTPAEIMPPDSLAPELAGFRAAASSLAPITLQREMALPTGTLHIETILVPVFDPATDRVVRIISGSRDLTERQRIEARLAHAQRLEAVGQLTGGVAHDFNNLLTVVIGNLSLLRSRLGQDARAQRYLASVEAAAERGARLTSSLLAFSRRQALQVEPVDVGDRIRESATLLRRAIGEEIEFALQIEPDLLPANADASKLEAAVLNLVINARDALEDAMAARAERSGRLRLSVRAATLHAADLESNDEASPGDFVAIAVEDSGTGMTPSVRARAFEPFFTTKEVGRGTGLGLSQVFGFVRQLGGHVTIDSAPGQGTRVTMFLPAARRSHPEPQPHAPKTRPMPIDATVLVVEDDAGIRDVTAEMLRDVGLKVRTAEDGPAALEILRGAARIDLLFSDVVLPGGATGIDLARAVHELRPQLPVLLTSGYDEDALDRFGADHEYEVLAKPYTRAVLLERIGALLSTSPVG